MVLAITVKLILVACLKFAFFSQPMGKSEAAQKIATLVSGSAPSAEGSHLPSTIPNPEKP
jgi:hypothetical protein